MRGVQKLTWLCYSGIVYCFEPRMSQRLRFADTGLSRSVSQFQQLRSRARQKTTKTQGTWPTQELCIEAPVVLNARGSSN